MIPPHLDGYEGRYDEDPRAAARRWFEDASFGMFVCYGLYSLLGESVRTDETSFGARFPAEWVQYGNRIPPAEYGLLEDHFTAEGFDAEALADLAQSCGMKYITFTAKFHDSFCLFDSSQTTFTSTNAPAGRDLVGELADACQSRSLGLFLYYSHGIDWRHPHAPNNDKWGPPARPEYDRTPGVYARDGHDLEQYLKYVTDHAVELLSNYGPIAGIWLDPSSVPQRDTERFAAAFDLESFYETIRTHQPHALISYKEGVTGTEDFVTLEHEAVDEQFDLPGELCTTMVPSRQFASGHSTIGHEDGDGINVSWGYSKEATGKHKTVDEVWALLRDARRHGHNLLLNTGLLPDGSVDPEDGSVFREVGGRIEADGFPG